MHLRQSLYIPNVRSGPSRDKDADQKVKKPTYRQGSKNVYQNKFLRKDKQESKLPEATGYLEDKKTP